MNHVATRSELSHESAPDVTVHPRMCPICEAYCGLLVEADTRTKRLVSIRGDHDDPFSKGFICAKGYSWTELHDDPNLIKTPLIKRDGKFVAASWEEAFDLIGERLNAICKEHGPDAVGFYFGNPIAHKVGLLYYTPPLLEILGSKNIYSASTVDTTPKFLSSALMFGDCTAVPVPDVDRTDYFVIQGGNPVVSNGSLLTAPGMPKRIKAIRERGGKVVVIDPRRTETAEIADQHISIRPGTDPYFLLAIINVLFAENLVRLRHLESKVRGIETIRALAAEYPPELVTAACTVPPDVIRQLAREFARSDSAAWYGRFGTCTQSFGTVSSWLQDVINVLTGNVDRAGGMMFPVGIIPNVVFNDVFVGDVPPVNRWQTRVSGLPEFAGTFPNGALIEEIMTPGKGQIRAFITMAGNPVLSNPNSQGLSEAFESLDFMVSLDIYLNETTRHADVILPSPPHAMHSDFPAYFVHLMVRNVPKWSAPIFPLEENQRHDWQALSEIAARLAGITVEEFEEKQLQALLKKFIAEGKHPLLHSVDPLVARAALGEEPGPDRIYDLLIRTGRNGDAFGLDPDGLNLKKIKQYPHGLDLGPMMPRLDEALKTPDRKIDVAPAYVVADMDRLSAALPEYEQPNSMVMIGRRDPRTNNSWMHNLHVLTKGKNRCTALIHPDDASRLKLSAGALVRVSTHIGAIELPVTITDAILPGVISIPHGWGHDMEGTELDIARRNPGVNFNHIVDQRLMDVPSGNAILSGVPVSVEVVAS